MIEEKDRIVSVDDIITYVDRNGIKPSLVTNNILKDIDGLTFSPKASVLLVNHKALTSSEFALIFDSTTRKAYLDQGYAGHLLGMAAYFKRGFILDYDFKLYALPFEFSTDRMNCRNPIYDVL
jgi:hypothetical protein